MFLSSLHKALIKLIWNDPDRIKQTDALEEAAVVSYICVHLDTDNRKLAVPLQKYFDGTYTKQLSQKIAMSSRYNIPVYSDLYDAKMHLARHGRGGDESRYILVVHGDCDTILQILKENDSTDFHKRITCAINWQSLAKEHQGYTQITPNKSTFDQIKIYDNPNIKIVYPALSLKTIKKPQNTCAIM